MTTQLKTTSTTAPPPIRAARKATKDPADQGADQFAAMLASLCLAPHLQPPPTPAAKPQEATLADGIDDPEIAVCDGTLVTPKPFIPLQTIATEMGESPESLLAGVSLTQANTEPTPDQIPESLLKGVSLTQANTEPAPDQIPESLLKGVSLTRANPETAPDQIQTTSTQQPGTASPSAPGLKAETPQAEVIILPQPGIGSAASTGLIDPMQPAAEAADIRVRFAEGPRSLSPQVVASNKVAEQTLQVEATLREANLIAGYLAKSARTDPQTGAEGAKTLLAGNGFDLRGDDREHDLHFDSRIQFSALGGEVSFATTVRDLQSNGHATSIQAQTISEIIAQAETLSEGQMRSFRLRLKPPELGQIDIQVTRDVHGRISAHISAESETARGTLLRSLDQLRETLLRAGLSVDKLQINADPGLFAGNRGSDDTGSNTRGSPSVVANLTTATDTESGTQTPAVTERLLSLRA
jgi:flagellar hook-length control protein FliK